MPVWRTRKLCQRRYAVRVTGEQVKHRDLVKRSLTDRRERSAGAIRTIRVTENRLPQVTTLKPMSPA